MKPPTTDEVLTNYLFHHKVLQEETKRQSSTRDAAVKTAEALKSWWESCAGIPCKSLAGLLKMIMKSVDQLKNIQSVHTQVMTKRRKLTPGITAKEIKYKLSLKKTFWAPSPNYEKILDELAKKGSEEAVEEKQFLNNMKLIDRPGGVSGMDMVTDIRRIKLVLSARLRKHSLPVNGERGKVVGKRK